MKILILFTFLFSFAAQAHDLTLKMGAPSLMNAPKPIPGPTPPPPSTKPTPPPSTKFPHWGYWKPIYDAGTTVSNEFLRGDWMLIAQATTKPCGFMAKDESKPKGIKNDDGTPANPLSFKDFPSAKGPIFGVTISNLGSEGGDQGPFELEPQEPQFATWTYSFGQIDPTSFFEYNCRGTDKGELICGLNLQGLLSTDPKDAIECANSPLGIFMIWAKKPKK